MLFGHIAVWQKLEEQNPEFFKAYYTRLKLKKQIVLFNHLLEQQVQLMRKMRLLSTPAPQMQNGMHPAPSMVLLWAMSLMQFLNFLKTTAWAPYQFSWGINSVGALMMFYALPERSL